MQQNRKDIEKEKQCSSEDVDGGGAVASSAGGGSRGGGGSGGGAGVSASLTPAIWEKTIPYDGETFHLEYMDLDEFLLENGIPVSLEEEELQRTLTSVETKGKPIPKVIALAAAAPLAAPPVAAVNEVSIPEPPDPSPSKVITDAEESVTVTTLQPAKLEEDEEEKRQEEESLTEEAPAEAEVKKTGK
ncbi:hypothetical protein ILYODFUR_023346 [Ilyodon furcidens]|uniref:Thyrotroph embryonic factor n=1 Tax=Ilyodon furcidens TaxID=33524 RepID=A0ABV0TCX9_9TELE